jgi:hypothetical protein
VALLLIGRRQFSLDFFDQLVDVESLILTDLLE